MVVRLLVSIALITAALPLVSSGQTTARQPQRANLSRQELTEIIRDRYGKKLGEIRAAAGGRREARDRFGRLLGSYDPRTNETRDRYGRLITKGNTLAALIMQAESK